MCTVRIRQTGQQLSCATTTQHTRKKSSSPQSRGRTDDNHVPPVPNQRWRASSFAATDQKSDHSSRRDRERWLMTVPPFPIGSRGHVHIATTHVRLPHMTASSMHTQSCCGHKQVIDHQGLQERLLHTHRYTKHVSAIPNRDDTNTR